MKDFHVARDFEQAGVKKLSRRQAGKLQKRSGQGFCRSVQLQGR
jgi:hypothetical protein